MDAEKDSLFLLRIDDSIQSHLVAIAKWNKFMAIAGIIISIIFVFTAVVSNIFLYNTSAPGADAAYIAGERIGSLFVYLIMIAVYLIPSIFRLKFANRLMKALNTNDQYLLTSSFGQLKIFTKFIGIATIILIVFAVLGFIVALIDLLR
ncbi:MAG TPA: hypothetical protein VG738_04080 [Chitinophagaceae bacterium]|nr:hypothetical protein [Chitinophagaceae bacterium]